MITLQYTLSNKNTPHSDQKLNYLVGSPVTLFSITTRYTVTKAELFSWEFSLMQKLVQAKSVVVFLVSRSNFFHFFHESTMGFILVLS